MQPEETTLSKLFSGEAYPSPLGLETHRQQALNELGILDTAREVEFDELVALASELCSVPISLVSLVDRDRQWFKAAVGVDISETPRSQSFCSHAIQQEEMLVVEDATRDDRFREFSVVVGSPHIRFYAGVPLFAQGNHPIGTLCIIDSQPRHLTAGQKNALGLLARQVQVRLDLRAKQRNLEKTLALNQDLTTRVLKTNDELELLLDSVAAILIGLNCDGRITYWNVAAQTAFGLAQEDVRGKHLSDCGIVWLEPEARIQEICRIGQQHLRGDYHVEAQGQPRWLDVTVSSLDKLDSAPGGGLLLSASDITSRLSLEQEVRQVHKMEAIGQLAAGIAHEINTPTQYIGDNLTFFTESWAGFARVVESSMALRAELEEKSIHTTQTEEFDSILASSDLTFVLAEVPKALDQALHGVRAISTIVNAMKEFSHPGSKAKTTLDLNRAVENTVALGRSEWKYVADVELQCDPGLAPIPCYPGEVTQVILNLLVNAAHAIADKAKNLGEEIRGTITITTRQENEFVELTIADTGTGIPKTIRERIFEPFFTTKEVGRGTGQGLAFAHAVVVQKHGGKLWVESEVGVGSTFGLRLPSGQNRLGEGALSSPDLTVEAVQALRQHPVYGSLLGALDEIACQVKRIFAENQQPPGT